MEKKNMEKPNISKSSSSLVEENPSREVDESDELNVTSFKLEWAIGMNVDVGVVNLTTLKRDVIAYACSHMVILYDYVTKDTTSLQGHQNAVRSLSASRDGKWLLSADHDEDCVCIVWDTETRVPICSLFNPHGNNRLTTVEISPDAKYIVTVGNEIQQVVNFWIWTRGSEEPDATVKLTETSVDRVKKINFNDENSSEFVLTLNRSVIFVSWKNSKSLEIICPKIPTKNEKMMENLNDSCYVSKNEIAMTVTNAGFVLVWSNSSQSEKFDPRGGANYEKRLVKAVPLRKGNLTLIRNENEIIAVGNDSGQLFFYDRQLKLLYWCKNCGFDSKIISMSFDRESDLKRHEIATSQSTVSEFNDEINDFTDDENEESILNSSLSNSNENEEEIIREDDEKNIVKSCAKSNEQKKSVSNEKNIFFKATKLLSASTITVDIDYQPKNRGAIEEPTDCSLQRRKFVIPKFFVSSASGKIGRLDVPSLICRFVLHPSEGAVTAIATRPKSEYVVTGNSLGLLRMYKYTTKKLMVSKKTPILPDFVKILNSEEGKNDTSYVTCPKTHESLIAVSALRFSPAPGGTLACGLESGAIWFLDPHTLDPIDSTPYKHSASKIVDLIFSECGKYLSYSDDGFTVGVFKTNDSGNTLPVKIDEKTSWIFLGKYHSHCMPVRQILFVKPAMDKTTIRFFSLGEDRNLVEYDLANSGPYPEPGLKILQTVRIERTAVPTCMTIYPQFGSETFLITANNEHKFRLLDDQTKLIRATFLGPTFGHPVRKMLIAEEREKRGKKRVYMIFATNREIGLTILPYDGNPHRIVAMIGHPNKIEAMAISDCKKYLFTVGQNDRSVLMWKIKYRSADTMEKLGGKKLEPFYSLIDGGKDGWLFNEMKDLFYYAQILQQGENTTSSRIVTDKVSILQIPNLMRAIGFYPTNNELENMMEEVSSINYAKTGKLVDEITFEEFVKLYVNHRPAFGTTKKQIKDVFRAFVRPNDFNENPSITAKQFLDVLFGRGRYIHNDRSFSNDKLYGEPLSPEEAHAYLRRLVPQDEDSASCSDTRDGTTSQSNFEFLPMNITYENFIEEILGIGQPN